MRILQSVLSATLLTFAFVSCSSQNLPSEPVATITEEITNLGRSETGIVQAQAVITAIDADKRLITVKNYRGEESTHPLGAEVRNFAQLRKGDTVTISYIQSVAYELREPTADEKAVTTQITEGSARAQLGQKPGMAKGANLKSLVTIDAVNLDAETVDVRGPRGNVFTVKAKYPERLKSIKVGDTAVVSYTEAVVVDVQP
jgi:hypothetical protein